MYKEDLHLLNNFDHRFHGTGEAVISSRDGLHQNHPPGGVAILWRRVFDQAVEAMKFDLDWLVGVRVNLGPDSGVILYPYTCLIGHIKMRKISFSNLVCS